MIPAASATATQDQSVPNESDTTIALDSERFDTRNMHSDGVENAKIVAPVDGVYLVSASVEWSANDNAHGVRVINTSKNDSGSIAYDARSTDTHEADVEVLSQTVSTAAFLEAGD